MDSAQFVNSASGTVTVRDGDLVIAPLPGFPARIAVVVDLANGVVRTESPLLLEADFFNSGIVIAPNISQQNGVGPRGAPLRVKYSGDGITLTDRLVISGHFEPSRHMELSGDLFILPNAEFQATVGPHNSSLDVRVNGSVSVDGAFVIIDELTGIQVIPDEYVEWSLFENAASMFWGPSGMTENFIGVEESREPPWEHTVIVRRIPKPPQTDRNPPPSPVSPPVQPPVMPPAFSPSAIPFVPPSASPSAQAPQVSPDAPPLSAPAAPPLIAPTSAAVPSLATATPSAVPSIVASVPLDGNNSGSSSSMGPIAIVILVIVILVAGAGVAFLVYRSRGQTLSASTVEMVDVPPPHSPGEHSPGDPEPQIELSEA